MRPDPSVSPSTRARRYPAPATPQSEKLVGPGIGLVFEAGQEYISVLESSQVSRENAQTFLSLPPIFIQTVLDAGSEALALALRAPPERVMEISQSHTHVVPNISFRNARTGHTSKTDLGKTAVMKKGSLPSTPVTASSSARKIPSSASPSKRPSPSRSSGSKESPSRSSPTTSASRLLRSEAAQLKQQAQQAEKIEQAQRRKAQALAREKARIKTKRQRHSDSYDFSKGSAGMIAIAEAWNDRSRRSDGSSGDMMKDRQDFLETMNKDFVGCGFRVVYQLDRSDRSKDAPVQFWCAKGQGPKVEQISPSQRTSSRKATSSSPEAGGSSDHAPCGFRGRVEPGIDATAAGEWVIRIESMTHNHPPEKQRNVSARWRPEDRQIMGKYVLKGTFQHGSRNVLWNQLQVSRQAAGIFHMPGLQSISAAMVPLKKQLKRGTKEEFEAYLEGLTDPKAKKTLKEEEEEEEGEEEEDSAEEHGDDELMTAAYTFPDGRKIFDIQDI